MSEFLGIAEDAIRTGLSELQHEVDEMIIPTRMEVFDKAQIFLDAYETAEKKYQASLKNIGKQKSRHLKQWAELEYARNAFDDFQNSINAYYHQLVKVMYVYMDPKTGQVTLSTQDSTTELLQINESYGSVQYHLNEIKNVFELEDYDATLLNAAEQSIYARWQIAKAYTKRNRFLPILWKVGGDWQGVKINNLGTIAEAYVNFYMARYQFSKDLEQNIGIYILHPSLGAAAVDNMSGFLIGDTSALNGAVQFAVKKDSASPMNMKKVYEETKAVINSEDFIEQLGHRFIEVEREKAINNQTKQLAENIKKTYKDLVEEIEKLTQ